MLDFRKSLITIGLKPLVKSFRKNYQRRNLALECGRRKRTAQAQRDRLYEGYREFQLLQSTWSKSVRPRKNSKFWANSWNRRSYWNLLSKSSPDSLNVPAVFMRKEPTLIDFGSTLSAGCRGYTMVFRARWLRTGSTRYGTTSIYNYLADPHNSTLNIAMASAAAASALALSKPDLTGATLCSLK